MYRAPVAVAGRTTGTVAVCTWPGRSAGIVTDATVTAEGSVADVPKRTVAGTDAALAVPLFVTVYETLMWSPEWAFGDVATDCTLRSLWLCGSTSLKGDIVSESPPPPLSIAHAFFGVTRLPSSLPTWRASCRE